MNPTEIASLMKDAVAKPTDLDFDGFPDPSRGWYVGGKGAETRAEAETRAAKFFLWLCEYLDCELKSQEEDVFDAGVAVDGEEGECEHDKASPRQRRRRTTLLIGHGDFMGLVLKRIVAGFGHYVENEGVPHRKLIAIEQSLASYLMSSDYVGNSFCSLGSAFVHFNTGITELEYFGNGRFLIMSSNQTPHFHPDEYSSLRSGGSLKDGWSYIVPNDEFILDAEVAVAFSDELEEHVREQTEALRALYLKSQSSLQFSRGSSNLSVEEVDQNPESNVNGHANSGSEVSFVVKRGLQVVGCATYNEQTGTMSDVVVRPSARGSPVGKTLVKAVREHARKLGRSGSVLFQPTTEENKRLFETLGFNELEEDDDDVHTKDSK